MIGYGNGSGGDIGQEWGLGDGDGWGFGRGWGAGEGYQGEGYGAGEGDMDEPGDYCYDDYGCYHEVGGYGDGYSSDNDPGRR